jgi:hypothetical protein
MEVMILGTLAGGIGVLLVLVVGTLLLRNRIAPVEQITKPADDE